VVGSTPRPHFIPGKDPVLILQEAGWAPGPVWTGGKSRLHRDSIPDRPVRNSVTIPTELPSPIQNGTVSKNNGKNCSWCHRSHGKRLYNQHWCSFGTHKTSGRPQIFSFYNFQGKNKNGAVAPTPGPFGSSSADRYPRRTRAADWPKLNKSRRLAGRLHGVTFYTPLNTNMLKTYIAIQEFSSHSVMIKKV